MVQDWHVHRPRRVAAPIAGTARHTVPMSGTRYEFSTVLYRWAARTQTWVFARVPLDVSDEIRDSPHPPAGFNSVKVEVSLGGSRWRTSVFPEAGDGSYSLPVKAAILRAERVGIGDTVTIGLETVV